MLMMNAGPVAVEQRVIAAMNRPALSHQSAQFRGVLNDVLDKLKIVCGTESWVTVLPGSGRLGLEAAISSVVERGDRTVHIVNGAFAAWAPEFASRAGAETTTLKGRLGGPIDLPKAEELIAAVRPKLVTLAHSETSTGALYDLTPIERICRRHDALLMVDAVSSVGVMPFCMDAMGVDLACTTSNKGLGSLNGLSMVGVSERAYAAMDARKTPCQSWSLDLKRWKDSFFGKPPPTGFPVVPSTHLVFALQEALNHILEEGLEARWARHHRYAAAVRKAVKSIGLQTFPDEGLESDCVTAIRCPEGIQEPQIRKGLAAHGVAISGCMPDLQGRVFRISHQGIQASDEMLIPTLVALERTLCDLGIQVPRGTMASVFVRALDQAPLAKEHA